MEVRSVDPHMPYVIINHSVDIHVMRTGICYQWANFIFKKEATIPFRDPRPLIVNAKQNLFLRYIRSEICHQISPKIKSLFITVDQINISNKKIFKMLFK